jgi:glutamate--cysteine ligase
MYFVYRDGKYLDASGQSFRAFMEGKLPACPGERPTITDWEDHLTTAFPEVRLKKFLEMRGADGGPWARLCALPAFWVGLLYHQDSLDAAWALTASWSLEERQKLRRDSARLGLKASIRGMSLQELALQLLELAHEGLAARGKLNASGDNESGFLSPLVDIAERGETPADRKLRLFETEWNGSVDPVFRQFAY